ncbi:hypothetical protein ABZW18_20365 [Streptomyces sp. NPDC004647]|uniref:hypothetical protein n=1 Tax=Streptomyces sp. NPDC004647 TaxID=3154671 RepID=UPI0033A52F73
MEQHRNAVPPPVGKVASGAQPEPPRLRPLRRWALWLSVGVGQVVGVFGSVTVLAFMAGWLFLTDLDQRYSFVMRCLGILALLAVLVMFCTLAAGKVWLSDTYAYAAHRAGRDGSVQAGIIPPLPQRMPGGRFARWRRAVFCVCLVTVAVGWFALAVGGRQVSPEVQEIDSDGTAVVRTVPIERIRSSEFQDADAGFYASRIHVAVPTEYGTEEADVDITGGSRPRAGERIAVLYSTESVLRGILAGEEQKLRAELTGEAFTPLERWIVFGCWMLMTAGVLTVLSYESRPGRRPRRIEADGLALRATVRGGSTWTLDRGADEAQPAHMARPARAARPASGTHHCLTLDSEAGPVPFIVDSAAGKELAEALGDEAGWLYRDLRGSTDLFAVAVLVGDSGWCLHGRLPVTALDAAAAGARSASDVADSGRRVRHLDPRAGWPARMTRGVLSLVFVCLFFGLLMVQDGDWELESNGQRWMIAVFSAAFTLALYGQYIRAIKPPPVVRSGSEDVPEAFG